MKFAIVALAGKQYLIREGQVLTVDRQHADKKLEISHVLLLADGGQVAVGAPYLKGKTIPAEILEHTRGAKVRVVKFKSKVHYKRHKGHRQHLTRIKIGKIPQA